MPSMGTHTVILEVCFYFILCYMQTFKEYLYKSDGKCVDCYFGMGLNIKKSLSLYIRNYVMCQSSWNNSTEALDFRGISKDVLRSCV